MAERKENVSNSEIIFALLAGPLFTSVFFSLYGYQEMEIDLLNAQLHFAETGDNNQLMDLQQNYWDYFLRFTSAGLAAGLLVGLAFMAGFNAARNASSEHKCSHRCSHHKPV
ncbi:MAG: hypothetical protein AAB439_02445 [Patescibacteria group bacterium]